MKLGGKKMERFIGKAFEELDEQEMINVQGGATPTTVTTTSSVPCGLASAGLTLISVFSATVASYATVKIF